MTSTQMPTQVTDYSPDIFNQIQDLHEVRQTFESNKGPDFASLVMGNVIKSHKLEHIFGCGLIHKHFSLPSTEILVEINNISTGWTTTPSTSANTANTQGGVFPSSWLLTDKKFMPYEFNFYPPNNTHTFINLEAPLYSEFLSDFRAALETSGFQNRIALRVYPGDDFKGGVEMSQSHANIIFTPDQYVQIPGDEREYTQTAWFFAPEYIKHGRKCVCVWNKKGFHKEHQEVKTK